MKRLFIILSACLLSMSSLYAQDTAQTEGYRIQDTFFGLKLGNEYSNQAIKEALSKRGKYMYTDSREGLVSHGFEDVWFGGFDWNYTIFMMTSQDVLYAVRFENSYSILDNEIAKSYYKKIAQTLDQKYPGPEILSEGENEQRRYFGNNGVGASLIIFKDNATNGLPHIFVDLYYVHLDTYLPIEDSQENEF